MKDKLDIALEVLYYAKKEKIDAVCKAKDVDVFIALLEELKKRREE